MHNNEFWCQKITLFLVSSSVQILGFVYIFNLPESFF